MKTVAGVQKHHIIARGHGKPFVHCIVYAFVRFAKHTSLFRRPCVKQVESAVRAGSVHHDMLVQAASLRVDARHGGGKIVGRIAAHGDNGKQRIHAMQIKYNVDTNLMTFL